MWILCRETTQAAFHTEARPQRECECRSSLPYSSAIEAIGGIDAESAQARRELISHADPKIYITQSEKIDIFGIGYKNVARPQRFRN